MKSRNDVKRLIEAHDIAGEVAALLRYVSTTIQLDDEQAQEGLHTVLRFTDKRLTEAMNLVHVELEAARGDKG